MAISGKPNINVLNAAGGMTEKLQASPKEAWWHTRLFWAKLSLIQSRAGNSARRKHIYLPCLEFLPTPSASHADPLQWVCCCFCPQRRHPSLTSPCLTSSHSFFCGGGKGGRILWVGFSLSLMVPGDGAILSLWISELVVSLINMGLNAAALFFFFFWFLGSEHPFYCKGIIHSLPGWHKFQPPSAMPGHSSCDSPW